MKVLAYIIVLLLPISSMAQSEKGRTFTRLDLCEIGGYFEAVDQTTFKFFARNQIVFSFPDTDFDFFAGPCVEAADHGRGVGEKSLQASRKFSQFEIKTIDKARQFKVLIIDSVLREADLSIIE